MRDAGEGRWRGVRCRPKRARRAAAAASALACLALTAAACGDGRGDASGAATEDTVRANDPERAFAPLVELAGGERHLPVSARWFIARSVLSVAQEEPCESYAIAVGRTLGEQRSEANDWIDVAGLGRTRGYYRNPYDERCEPIFDRRFYTSDLTRPHDPGPRPPELGDGVGFYLDLVDEARVGDDARAGESAGDDATPVAAPVYAERTDEGDSGVRITYWMLFGMNVPPGRPEATHEGDWERVDVLLRDEGDDRYVPQAVQVNAGPTARSGPNGDTRADSRREIPWAELERLGETHPVVTAAAGSHAMAPSRPGARCPDCVRWRTWDNLADASRQPWYGFGGAWGEPGPTDATTGPLGPHDHWPTDTDRDDGRSKASTAIWSS